MIIFGLLFLLLQLILVFFKPRWFLITYFIYLSSFLGLFNNQIIIFGIEIGLFFHNMLMLFYFLYQFKKLPDVDAYLNILVWGLIIFYFYGILKPIIDGNSSIIQSIIASKEFSSIFIFHFLIVNYKKINYLFLKKVLRYYGVYLLFVLFLFSLFGLILPAYLKRPGEIQFNYPAILSLFLFVFIAEASKTKGRITGFFFILMWTIGMYYEGHAAILITTLLGSLIILFKVPILYFFRNVKNIFKGLVLLILLLFSIPTGKYIEELSNTGSFRARNLYNLERVALIQQKPIFGYGFIHKSALQLGDGEYTESFSFIDSGYIDQVGKFGLLGTIIYLMLLIVPFFVFPDDQLILSLKIFILQFILVNVTWSVFTFTMGNVAIGLALFILYSRIIERREFDSDRSIIAKN